MKKIIFTAWLILPIIFIIFIYPNESKAQYDNKRNQIITFEGMKYRTGTVVVGNNMRLNSTSSYFHNATILDYDSYSPSILFEYKNQIHFYSGTEIHVIFKEGGNNE